MSLGDLLSTRLNAGVLSLRWGRSPTATDAARVPVEIEGATLTLPRLSGPGLTANQRIAALVDPEGVGVVVGGIGGAAGGGVPGPAGPTGPAGPAGPTGATGSQGPAGTPGEKWFSGSGAPAGATGIVGDWYLDTASGDVYEKTAASTWTVRGNIRGPQGLQGIQGPQGPAGSAPAYVTSLPGSPTDGLEVYYAADATTGVVWHLRYRAAIAGAQKWECVGGSPLWAESYADSPSVTSTTYVDVGSPPQVTVPLAGSYMVDWGARSAGSVATAQIWTALKRGAAAADDADGATTQPAGANYIGAGQSMRRKRFDALAAATALRMQHKVNTGSMLISQRWISAVPVLVG